MPLIYDPAARTELIEAAAYYEECRPGHLMRKPGYWRGRVRPHYDETPRERPSSGTSCIDSLSPARSEDGEQRMANSQGRRRPELRQNRKLTRHPQIAV